MGNDKNCCCGGGEAAPETREHLESVVRKRYAAGASQTEPALCCPTQGYEQKYLKILPQEIIDKDYGCGDPSAYVEEGETVLDLGSGAGKICYMLAQKVGSEGQVIGVDFNDAMLALARKYEVEMTEKLCYRNFRFVKGKIQDLELDLEQVQAWLNEHPIRTVEEIAAFDAECERLRDEEPMIDDETIDVVVSNCVLNLVQPQDKEELFAEIFRVLKFGGRAVISDIVCDENPTAAIQSDPELWSGCLAGAFREDKFLAMFEEAGFQGIEILKRQEEPWQVIDGVEFRSITVRAFKCEAEPGLDLNQALIYKGPWRRVMDDQEQVFLRGQRMAVSDLTFAQMTDPASPYSRDMIAVPSQIEVDPLEAEPFDSTNPRIRQPRETKWLDPPCACGDGECDGDCDCDGECDCEDCDCDDEDDCGHRH